jgi:hemerythrin-like domain-containing protein
MRPSEIRLRVLADHEVLRVDLLRLESLAAEGVEPAASQEPLSNLRGEAERFLARLREHMRWEEIYLLPALEQADAWGQERAQRLVDDHREQRELLDLIVTRLRDPERPDAIVARDINNLIGLLREDMCEEEADLLDERVLRDDVIAIEMETG